MSEIRKFIPVLSEYKQAIAVESANFPDEEISIESWKWHDQHFDPNTIFSRWVGETDSKIISHGLFTQMSDQRIDQANHFMLHIAVHPEQQYKGYGSELYQHFHRHLQQYMPCIIETIVREDKPQSMNFLEHRHFKAKSKQYIVRLRIPINRPFLDLTGYSEQLSKLGIRIDPLSDLIDHDRDWQNKLEAQYKSIIIEMQNSSLSDLSAMKKSLEFDPQKIFIARYHEHWIGVSGIRQSEKQRHTCIHTLTGVAKPYRRNGIATTLIQHCINSAIQSGFHFIESSLHHDSVLFQLQQKLGYISQPTTIHYELNLS